MAWPPDLDEVLRELGVASVTDPVQLQSDLDAAVALVEQERADLWLRAPDPPTFEPDPRVHKGTVRYAARINMKRSSMAGVDPVTGLGGVADVYAVDADVAQLIQLRQYRRPAVG